MARKLMTFLLAALALVAVPAFGPAHAQVNPFRTVIVPATAGVQSVSTQITAVDTAPALLIRYVGTSSSATVAVTSDDFIFTTDGTTADSTINVQATSPCGAAVGTLDTGDSDCDTVGEVINKINASANWVAIPIGVLATDNAAAYFKDLAETSVAPTGAGVAVYNDSATTLQTTNAFVPNSVLDARDFMDNNTLKKNYWLGYHSVLEWYIQNFVGSAGAGAIYCVTGTYGGSTGKVYSESVRTVLSFTGAATGVDKELDYKSTPLFCNPGEHFVFRGASGSTHTSPVQRARGFIVQKQ